MQIIWHGQSCFEIIAAKGKGEHVTVLIDPLDEDKTGLRTPKTDAQIVLLTNRDYTANQSDIKKIAPGAFIVDGPGEYEARGVYIQGTAAAMPAPAPDDKEKKTKGKDVKINPVTIYTIEAEEMKLCHLGALTVAELPIDMIERIGNIDIMMSPVGNGRDLGAKEALKIISQIEPSLVVPMNYEIPKLKLDAHGLPEFLKAAGLGSVEALPKLTIKKKEISPEEARIVILNP
jgi:L-ascorbate metabolism protein UlaG (beta-lactamase superfamily)